MEHSGKLERGVQRVDAAGRRWYTRQFKSEIVAQCARPGASVSKIAVDHGLNPNLVRKWIERSHEVDAMRVTPQFIPVDPLGAVNPAGAERTGASIRIRIGSAVISIGETANPALVRAIVQALR